MTFVDGPNGRTWFLVTAAASSVVTAAAISTCLAWRAVSRPRTGQTYDDYLGTTRFFVTSTFDLPDYDTIINMRIHLRGDVNRRRFVERTLRDMMARYRPFRCVPTQAHPLGPITWLPTLSPIPPQQPSGSPSVSQPEPSTSSSLSSTPTIEQAQTHVFEYSISFSVADVNAKIATIVNRPLYINKTTQPWWEVHALPLRRDDPSFLPTSLFASRPPGEIDGSSGTIDTILVVRIHHALGDGASLVQAIAPLLTDSDTHSPLDMGALLVPPPPHRSVSSSAIVSPGRISSLCRRLRRIVTIPFHAWSSLRRFQHQMGPAVVDTPTGFQGTIWPYCPNRVPIYFPSHALATVDRIRHNCGIPHVTVNTVEYALMAGCIRRFLQFCHDETRSNPGVARPSLSMKEDRPLLPHPHPDAVRMRSLSPFSIPAAAVEDSECLREDPSAMLGNRWAFPYPVGLPVHLSSPMERLRHSHDAWEAIKQSPTDVACAFVMAHLAGQQPLENQRQGGIDLSRRTSLVFTNVRGPNLSSAITFDDHRVASVHVVYPNLLPMAGVFSVDGSVHVCLTMCPELGGDLLPVRSLCKQDGGGEEGEESRHETPNENSATCAADAELLSTVMTRCWEEEWAAMCDAFEIADEATAVA